MQFIQKRLSNWNHHISAFRNSRIVYKSFNSRFSWPLFIDDRSRCLLYIESWEIQINTQFVQIRQKRQYHLGKLSKNKHILISMQNFKAIGATSFELSHDKKLCPKLCFFAFSISDWVKAWNGTVKNPL